jgi:hypothetical protein
MTALVCCEGILHRAALRMRYPFVSDDLQLMAAETGANRSDGEAPSMYADCR